MGQTRKRSAKDAQWYIRYMLSAAATVFVLLWFVLNVCQHGHMNSIIVFESRTQVKCISVDGSGRRNSAIGTTALLKKQIEWIVILIAFCYSC